MCNKKRIFINMHYMALGGAERALLGLLNSFDTEKVEVDLFLNQHTGEFMSLIPSNINVLPERRGYNAIERPMKIIAKEGQLGILWGRLKAKYKHRCYHRLLKDPYRSFDNSVFQFVFSETERFLGPLSDLGVYDLAISFMQPHNIVLNKVMARKKIAWIHTDYSTIHVNSELELPIWRGFDHIVSISKDCTSTFLKTFPSLSNKIIEIENILSPSFVRTQAGIGEKTEVDSFKGVKLVSVGRICHAKNYDNIPNIAQILMEKGFIFKWFIVGPGSHSEIDKKISETGTDECVKFLGPKDNPYPFIRDCDIYMQPSRYEGKSITVREAQILCKPVIITDYKTAKSQIKDGVDGIICSMDNNSIAQSIFDLYNDKKKMDKIVSYLSAHDYGNEKEIDNIYNLI